MFDRPDKGGDIIRKGAFAKALRRAGEVPLLWQQVGAASFLTDEEKRAMLGFTVVEAREPNDWNGGGGK